MLKSITKRIGSRDLTPGLAFNLVFVATGYTYPSKVLLANKNQIVFTSDGLEFIAGDGVASENIQILSRQPGENGTSFWITEEYGERVMFRAAE